MNKETIEITVKQILADLTKVEIKSDEIKNEDSLIDDYNMDSVQILGVIMALEEEFDITFEDEDLTFDIFEKVESLTDFVDRHLAGKKV